MSSRAKKRQSTNIDEDSDSASLEVLKRPPKKVSKRIQSKDEDEADSGSEEVPKKAVKEVTKRREINHEEGIVACELSKNRKVVVRQFKSSTMVDIREFWGDNNTKPSKKGICLTVDQWKVLREHVHDVDEAIEEYS